MLIWTKEKQLASDSISEVVTYEKAEAAADLLKDTTGPIRKIIHFREVGGGPIN